jgi:hypothetical protein
MQEETRRPRNFAEGLLNSARLRFRRIADYVATRIDLGTCKRDERRDEERNVA